MNAVADDEFGAPLDLEDLVYESHKMAVEKGWWPEDGRLTDEIVNNLHSEVSEAWEEYRHGRLETWHADPDGDPAKQKPEGFWVEIADLMIRLGDCMGQYRWTPVYQNAFKCFDIPEFIDTLHKLIDTLTWNPELRGRITWSPTAGEQACKIMMTCLTFSKEHDHDIWTTIGDKMKFNATRAFRHGNLRA